jgi:hypothetical protein
MATQGPSLQVQASPVNTFVAAAAPAVALYDQQQANMALQLVDAFSNLSVTAARFAGSLKAEQNEEDIRAGMDLVNRSRKSYQKLVESGEIKPTENPWMAVGAQSASGTLEGMKARAEFERIYAMKAAEDPKFFDSPEAFDALAAQYAQNANTNLGDGSYQTQSFYQAFNPYIAAKAMQHEDAIAKFREERILTGIQASVAKAVEDYRTPYGPVQTDALQLLQETLDTPTGVSRQAVNNTVIDSLVYAMANGNNPEKVEELARQIKSGTGLLMDTEYARALMAKAGAEIERNKDRLTREESVEFSNWLANDLIPSALKGMKDEDIRKTLNDYFAGPERKITVSAQEMESKIGYAFSQIEKARNEEERRVEEEKKNAVVGVIGREMLNRDRNEGLKTLRDTMDRLDIPEEQRWMYEDAFDRRWDKAENERLQQELSTARSILWFGTTAAPGLQQEAAQEFTQAYSTGELPNFGSWKTRIDNFLIDQGVTPDTERAKSVYGQYYSDFDKIIDAQSQALANQYFNGNSRPAPGDDDATRATKAAFRGRTLMLKMQLGLTFDDQRVVSQSVNEFLRVLNPESVEGGAVDMWPAEDLIYAYSYAVQNNLPLDMILPGGENGRALRETLAYAANEISAGVDMDNVVRDVVSRKFFGEASRVTRESLKMNLMGYADITTGSGQDAVDYTSRFMGFMSDAGVTQSDSQPFGAHEFQRHYFDGLGRTHNHKAAMTYAMKSMRENYMVVRGSLLPLGRGFKDFVDESYIESWLDANYPGKKDASLVVVSRDVNGAPLMAVRDGDGRALAPVIDGQRQEARLYRVNDINAGATEAVRKAAMKAREFRRMQQQSQRLIFTNRPELQ